MSRYPVKYLSGSKKAELNIEDMATPHLMNAWRKLGKAVEGAIENLNDTDKLHCAMRDELKSRGATYDAETDRWALPPKAEEAP
jgi:hypothetical protein